MTYLASAAFAAIALSLAAALYFMLKGGEHNERADKGTEGHKDDRSGRMARALTFRIGFSILLFICILLGWKLGYLHPTGIPAGK